MSDSKCENLTKTFTFLVGILPSPTLRNFRAGPFEKNTLYNTKYADQNTKLFTLFCRYAIFDVQFSNALEYKKQRISSMSFHGNM